MKIGTMSIVCGTEACNAHCPFCVSKMTPASNLRANAINYRNLDIACRLAEKNGATTCLITGKGEPTLYPNSVASYIDHIRKYFPFIELQTNGINLLELNADYSFSNWWGAVTVWGGVEMSYLEGWYKLGLTTISISAVETGSANKKIYGENYPDLGKTVKVLHDIGYTVRLSIIMLKGYIDSPKQIDRVVAFCQDNKIKQLTIRPVSRPDNNDNKVCEWVDDHKLSDKDIEVINNHFNTTHGITPVLHLAHGATVYDYKGQNVCLTNCLTTNDTDDNIRQIIYFPDGTIGYDWCFRGAILL
jgi:pyruvate-formate lyase-activating enzyme